MVELSELVVDKSTISFGLLLFLHLFTLANIFGNFVLIKFQLRGLVSMAEKFLTFAYGNLVTTLLSPYPQAKMPFGSTTEPLPAFYQCVQTVGVRRRISRRKLCIVPSTGNTDGRVLVPRSAANSQYFLRFSHSSHQ